MLKSTLDSVDTLARVTALAVTIRKVFWLQNLGIAPGVQQVIKDFPFDGQALFSDRTDARLHSFKDSTVFGGIHAGAAEASIW